MAIVINGIDESDLISKLNSFLTKNALHCSKCGFVLPRNQLNCEYGVFVSAKCTNNKCRLVNKFVFVDDKAKLLTKRLLDKTPEGYWQPYSKDDMLGFVTD
jgi:hypothetical protein